MSELSLTRFVTAVRERPVHRPLSGLPAHDERRWLGEFTARATGTDPARTTVLDTADPEEEQGALCAAALTALGPGTPADLLCLVRSGPLPDSRVSLLPRLVHEHGWPGEDLGLTHLDDRGGTAVFGLLDWAVPDGAGAAVLISDEPPVRVAGDRPRPHAVVGLRLRHGPGALRITAAGEGRPRHRAAHTFAGPGPCGAWLALAGALTAGRIRPGESVLLRTADGSTSPGWALVEVTDPEAARPLRAGGREGAA